MSKTGAIIVIWWEGREKNMYHFDLVIGSGISMIIFVKLVFFQSYWNGLKVKKKE